MTKARTRSAPFVLLGLLTLAFVPAFAQPPGGPAPEVACPTPCDDQNACTTDSCDTTTGTCRYEAISCDDGNPCTADSCSPSQFTSLCHVAGCCHVPLAVNTPCNDGNSCTTGDVCENGGCFGMFLQTGAACDDGNSCTELDSCNASHVCVGLAVPAGSPCSDGTACTTADTCADNGSGVIVCSGTPADCSDSNPCTQDLCDSASGICSNPPVSCDDGNQCTTDSLACSGGLVCNHIAHTGSCQDVDPCTPADFCSDGVCVSSGNCDDHVDCTQDICDQGSGCLHAPQDSLCADNNPCTFNERCLSTGCTRQVRFGAPCLTGIPCTIGTCSVNGECDASPSCVSSSPCTQALCDASTGTCSFQTAPDGTTCSDSNMCTQTDTCNSGTCVGSSPDPTIGLPVLYIVSLTPNFLEHAHHQLVAVHATVTAATQCGQTLSPILVSITSSQPDDAPGPSDGHTTGDIQGAEFGTSDFDFLLRAEFDRDSLTPRFYKITYSATANGTTLQMQASIQVFQKKSVLPAGSAHPTKDKETRD